jgi:hypothetical protein
MPDRIRLLALRRLLTLTTERPGSVDLSTQDVERLERLLEADATVDEIAIELDVPIDLVMPILWRVAQAA